MKPQLARAGKARKATFTANARNASAYLCRDSLACAFAHCARLWVLLTGAPASLPAFFGLIGLAGRDAGAPSGGSAHLRPPQAQVPDSIKPTRENWVLPFTLAQPGKSAACTSSLVGHSPT